MRRIAPMMAALVLAAGCNDPTQPGRENAATQPTFHGDNDDNGAVVQVARPTGNPAVDVPNIQAAVDAATPGAVIQFARGRYALAPETRFIVSVPRVTLQGHRRGTTILGHFDPDFQAIHFILNGGAQTVRNLTFEGFPLALLIEEPATPTGRYRVENCTFRNGDLPLLFLGSSDVVSRVLRNKFINVTLPFIIVGKTVHIRGNKITSPSFDDHPLGRPFNAGVLAQDGLACENNVLEENTVVGNADGFIFFDCRNTVIRRNTFIDQVVISSGDNGSMVWGVGAGFQGNRIEKNVLRGSEGLGVVVEEGSANRIVENRFRNLPGGTETFTPFSGTAIFLGEPTTGNVVRENEFKRVLTPIVDLGTGNIIKDEEDDDDDDDLDGRTAARFSVTGKGLSVLDHPKFRVARERMRN